MERKLTLSLKQVKKLKIISMFSEGAITRTQASERLGLSERQISRLRREYERTGDQAVVHKNSGRKPANAVSNDTREMILRLRGSEELKGVNHSHFTEILHDVHGIRLSRPTIHRVLCEAGVKSPKAKRYRGRQFRRRSRKRHPGELLQIDATPFEWFGGKTKFALHGAIDDATGSVVGLYMTKDECMFGYFQVMGQCILDFGIPQSLYSDCHTIFRSPKTRSLETRGENAPLTQFGRAMDELGTDIIYAHSPQAKGRVERLWATLQGRLPVEFARRGIKTVSDANTFLLSYRAIYNSRFSINATAGPMYVEFPASACIDDFLCVKHTRRVDNTSVFSFKGRTFRIDTEGYPLIPKGASVTLCISPKFGIRAEHGGRVFDTVRCMKSDKGSAIDKAKRKRSENKVAAVTPHLIHSSDEWKRIWWSEGYQDSIEFLFSLFFDKVHKHRGQTDVA
jgi:transposase